MRRALTSGQLKLRKLIFGLLGTLVTPTAFGFYWFGISIIDLGLGNYTMIFDYPFERACMVTGFASLTAEGVIQVTAVAYDRVTVQIINAAGADIDADFTMEICGSDGRFDQ